MSEVNPTRTGGQLLVDALLARGCELAFGVPGESYLAVLDALHDVQDQLRFIACRQEGGAAFMAEAYGKLTGRPGVCLVTRGPGATNAAIGVHTAFQDSTPMVLLIGQVGSDFVDREAFQEMDYRRMFGPMAKWIASIESASRVPEYINRAWQVALSGRPGPVVLALPEDMLTATAHAAALPPQPVPSPGVRAADVQSLQQMLDAAERPLLLLGGGGWTPTARDDLRRFVHASGMPVATTFRRQDVFDNRDAHHVGVVGLGMDPQLARRVREADLLLVAGSRLGENTTLGYELVPAAAPSARPLVHVHPAAQEIGVLYDTALAINADMASFASALAGLRGRPDRWRGWTEDARRDYLANLQVAPGPFALDLGQVVAWLNERLAGECIVTNGAGNYTTWLHRYFQHGPQRLQLAPTSGAMGYAVPAAVAAKLVHPDRTVVSFSGDGCYLMNGQELGTAVQYGAPVIFIVVNNGTYGTIRMHQHKRYPGRPSGTDLRNPDFAALARAYGAHGETVLETAAFAPAFERALASGGTALIELRTDARAVTSRLSLPA
jgi:acetolactate synthase-1/2/3 large subunit